MTTNRLYSLFSLITLLALVSAGAMAIPMIIGSLNLPPASGSTVSQSQGAADPAAAEQARFEFRRGEWFGGRDITVVTAQPLKLEFQRYLWYHGQLSPAALADQARFDQRRGEWFGK
jgi:hypothetical protein